VGALGGAAANGVLTAQAAPPGPATLTVAGAPVADWGIAACLPGAACVLPTGTAHLTIRLDLTGVAAGTSVPVTVTTSAAGATSATAIVTLAPAERPAGLSFVAVDHGGLAMAANTVLTCVEATGACGIDNNDTDLGYVDVGTGDAFNSSDANVALPAGATVTHAVLQWGGVPGEAPDPSRLGTVLFTGPDGVAVDLPAATVRRTGDAAYVASVDVTAALKRMTNVNGTYEVGNIQTGTGPGQFGGWSLSVAYHLDSEPERLIAVFDDPSAGQDALTRVDGADSRHDQMTGLAPLAQAGAIQVAVTAFDGDRSIKGDSLKVGPVVVGDASNFFSSTIAVGGAPRSPSLDDEYGFDAHLVTVPAARPAGSTSVTVTAETSADNFFLGPVLLAVSL
jgi:hypothetical protein